MLELTEWDSFCVIVGSSAGALIGLQFVVMTLIAARSERPSADAGAAFATPTVVHFCTVLFLAAVLRAPWKTVLPAAIFSALIGFVGIAYALFVIRRMRVQGTYQPELVDWFFYAFLPLATNVLLVVSALAVFIYTSEALFGIGASMLLMLFTGIRNAWDNIAYHVFAEKKENREPEHQFGEDKTDDCHK